MAKNRSFIKFIGSSESADLASEKCNRIGTAA